jgi:hypothetical protein
LAHFVYLSCYENLLSIYWEFSGCARITRLISGSPKGFIISGFFVQEHLLPAQKKRYVYMFQSGIMNYKG